MTTSKKPVVKPIQPDNAELYKRTQSLFKKRAEARKARQAYKAGKKAGEDLKAPKPPNWLNKPRLDFTVPETKSVYRPQHWLSNISKEPKGQNSYQSSRSCASSKAKGTELPRQVSLPCSAYKPPPRDSNYSQVPARFVPRNFVDCDKCGKRNFSSRQQLTIHQSSKKCKNRQLHFKSHRCEICKRSFDTPHNLDKHICRFK